MMRIFLLVVIFAGFAGAGIGVGFWRYQQETRLIVENFGSTENVSGNASEGNTNSASVDNSASTARIEVVGGSTFDFGVMQKGTSRSHKFVFKNLGSTPVELELIRTSCKCTLGSFGKGNEDKTRKLAPGEQTEVEMTWTAESILREFGQTATIMVMPNQEEIKLTIKGYIAESLEFEPSQILLGDFTPKESIKRQAKIFSNFSAPLTIEDIQWRNESTADRVKFQHKVRKLEKGEDPEHQDAQYVADLDIEILPGMPSGNISGAVIITTGYRAEDFGKMGDINNNFREGVEFHKMTLDVEGRVVSDIQFFGGLAYDEEFNVYTVGEVDSKVGKSFFLSVAFRAAETEDVNLTVGEVFPKDTIEVMIDKPTRRSSRQVFRITMKIPEGVKPVDLPGTNPQNYAKITFRSNLSYAPEIPLFLRLQIK